jgi:Sec-independent protein translocase protein TatA
MFDFGFSEIACIALVALLVLGPADMMRAARTVRGWWQTLLGFREEARKQMRELIEDSGLEETHTIIDLDGNPQVAYDVSDLEDMRDISPKTPTKPHP